MKQYCLLRDSETLQMLVKSRLQELGLSINVLAKQMNVSEKHLQSYFEKGTHRISQLNVLYMCYLLGIEVDLSIRLVSPPSFPTT